MNTNTMEAKFTLKQINPSIIEKPAGFPFDLDHDLYKYDRYVCFFSAGKDSQALLLHLLERGISKNKIELHHHIIDGREGSSLMDWPCTTAYVEAFAAAMDIPLFLSWHVGGLETEMLRQDALTAPTRYQNPDGSLSETGGTRGKRNTRMKFPQVTADLSQRWCSAYGKIDVGSKILSQSSRFRDGKTLVLTGERAEESKARANYAFFEPHRTDLRHSKTASRRWIDHLRLVHNWSESRVWDTLKRHRIQPHPAYRLGWGRCSCMTCIFGSANQWATIRKYAHDKFNRIAQYEDQFGFTIHRQLSVRQLADLGTPYPCDPEILRIALSESYTGEIVVSGDWQLPAGAFGESNGPT